MLHSSVAHEKSEKDLIVAAKAGDERACRDLLAPLERELLAYAYRMLGGFQDAEDALQETRLKAWRHLDSYDVATGSSQRFRAWIYRIATNTCLDLLRKERRRMLPQDLGAPPVAPGPPQTEPRHEIAWLEPYPDALLPGASPDPEALLRLHEGVRLALVRAMQLLPHRQRASLILHDVLDFGVDEVASMLETTTAAINSALQRARASIRDANAKARAKDPARAATQQADAMAEFVRAWETGDFDRLVSMLTEDAVMSMPPWMYWLDGREACAATFLSPGTWNGSPGPGRYRIVPTRMNGQPAGLAYVKREDGQFAPVCLTVMDLDADGRVFDMIVFVLPDHFATWGFPATLDQS